MPKSVSAFLKNNASCSVGAEPLDDLGIRIDDRVVGAEETVDRPVGAEDATLDAERVNAVQAPTGRMLSVVHFGSHIPRPEILQ